MLFKSTAVLACLAFAQAVPTTITEGTLTDLIARQGAEKFRDQLPGCGDDPTFAPKSGYKKEQGKKVPKDGKDDACTTGHNSDHCWTEYYIVESEIEYNNWVNSGAAIDCNSTSRCSSTDIDLGQTCESHTVSHSDGGEWKILDVAIDGKIWEGWGLKAGNSVSYKWDNSKSDQKTVCTSQSARNQCTWEDDKCHQIWYAQRDARLYGYAMRVCNGKTDSKNTQMNEQKSDGKWIRGMEDFSIRLPINKLVGCNAKCEEHNYPEPKPSEPGRHPFTADW
ncbi:hypothetical protein F4821DRAFT_281377 [Hypoxylon rubiginosum]|uniref:Uncharacterized protein n=1 Tax=Hypoxylon rubiginosum TaxID=110542 RepID=A0ACC0CRF1_9PEZI|nr:hypothetical protein F4821DRAFT_281377 [Hypoxylon rubiginosum]